LRYSWVLTWGATPEEVARRLPGDELLDLRGRPFDPAGTRPPYYTDGVWGFPLEELPGDRTRLIVSGYADARPKSLQDALNFIFWEPAYWVMQMRQFANLKRRKDN
jgi:hypothetical protein